NSQFVRTCLVVNWEQEEKEKAGASLVEVRANDLIRDFLRIELVKSTISYTRKRYGRTSAGPSISPNSCPCTSRRFGSYCSPCFFGRNPRLRTYS
uniref:Uncharacterized protein n=1 Tax=Aegilops tauschii subsp. strangulata TaxID=200361 RepID=A0A453RLY4_AEGTS